MEDILQVYRDLTGEPFNLQQPPGFGSAQSFGQLLGGIGIDDQLSNWGGVNSLNFNSVYNPFPNGLTGQNMVSENTNEETEQGYQRIKWTNEMVKVLITAVSFYESIENEWSHIISVVKSKWRSVSTILVERGYLVSPQQCEDKFNDLNKKFKRLIQILGTDTSYNVVENPALMETVNIPDEARDEVRRILTCRQLFFREMYSYHNKDDKFLPRDLPLQQSMLAALNDLTLGSPLKKRKPEEDNGIFLPHHVATILPEETLTEYANVVPSGREEEELSEIVKSRSSELEEKRLQIQMRMLELEKKRFEYLKLCRQEEEELQQMMLDNKSMMIENERLAHMLKCRKRGNNASN